MKYNFNDSLQKSNYFKFQEGQNKIRVLSKGVVLAEHYKLGVCYGQEKGCPFHGKEYEKVPARPKWMMWIIDRLDSQIKLARMPYKIIKAIADLQSNEDFAFDEIPMPYDLVITVKNARTINVEYTVLPSMTRIPLTSEEDIEFSKQNSIEDVVQRMKDKQKEKNDSNLEIQARREELRQELEGGSEIKEKNDYPEINPEEIPF